MLSALRKHRARNMGRLATQASAEKFVYQPVSTDQLDHLRIHALSFDAFPRLSRGMLRHAATHPSDSTLRLLQHRLCRFLLLVGTPHQSNCGTAPACAPAETVHPGLGVKTQPRLGSHESAVHLLLS